MTKADILQLQRGDEVFYTDPGDATLSRFVTIGDISTDGAAVVIRDIEGETLECFPWELS